MKKNARRKRNVKNKIMETAEIAERICSVRNALTNFATSLNTINLPVAGKPTVDRLRAEINGLLEKMSKLEAGDLRGVAPEFGRTADVQRLFGLKRGTLYNLYNEGKILGRTLRVRGQTSGVRLWDLESVRKHIRAEMNEEPKQVTVASPAPGHSECCEGQQSKSEAKVEVKPPAAELPTSVASRDEKLILQCIDIIRAEQRASVSFIQRRLGLGFSRASRIMDELERRGIVGPSNGSGPRELLIKNVTEQKPERQMSIQEIIELRMEYTMMGLEPPSELDLPRVPLTKEEEAFIFS